MNTLGRPPSASIFIGNVGFGATEEELKALFLQAGPLKSFRLVTDRDTGKTKGFAFAEYFDVATAQSAQRNLHGQDFVGRPLRIDFADNERYGDQKGNHGGKPHTVGKEAAAAAEQGVTAALGGSGGTGQQQISEALSKMTRPQIYEIMSQMKTLIQQNPAQARQILVQNPQLTKALFQAEILLGMVKIPVGNPQPGMPAPMGNEPQPNGPPVSQANQPQGQPQPGLQQMGPGPGPGPMPGHVHNPGPQQGGPGPQGPQGPQGMLLQGPGPMQHMQGPPGHNAPPQGSQPMPGGLQPPPGQFQHGPGPMQGPPGQFHQPPGQFHPQPGPGPGPNQPQQMPFPQQQPGPGPQGGPPFGQPGFPPIQGQPGLQPPQGGFPMQPGPQNNFPQQGGPRPQGMQGPMPGQMPFPGPQQQGGPMGQQPMPLDPRMMNQPAPFDPRQQPGPHDPGQQGGPHHMQDPRQQPIMDPRQQQQPPLDPRQRGMPMGQQASGPPMQPFNPHDPRQHPQPGNLDPRQHPKTGQDPRQDPRAQQQQQPGPQPGPQPQAGPQSLGHAEQQALLRQVMSLTPQQIDMLPEAQRQQVLELQRQLRSQVGIPG